MSKLTKEEYLKELENSKYLTVIIENQYGSIEYRSEFKDTVICKMFEQLINEHFKDIEWLKGVIKIQRDNLTDNYSVGLYNGLVTALAIIEDTLDYELAKCINDNKPYEFEDLKAGMWIWDNKFKVYYQFKRWHNNSWFVAKYSSFIINDGENRELNQGLMEFEPNRFYPREVKENGKY